MTEQLQDNLLLDYLIQANQLRHKRYYLQAIEIYVKLIKQFKEISDLARAIAHCHFNLGFYENNEREKNLQLALDWMKKAIELAPDDSQLHTELGEFFALGMLDYSLAVSEYKTAIKLYPNNAHALIGAASLYGLPDEVVTLQETIEWLSLAAQLESNNPVLHFRLGMLLLESNQSDNAEKELKTALLCPIPFDTNLAESIKKKIGK